MNGLITLCKKEFFNLENFTNLASFLSVGNGVTFPHSLTLAFPQWTLSLQRWKHELHDIAFPINNFVSKLKWLLWVKQCLEHLVYQRNLLAFYTENWNINFGGFDGELYFFHERVLFKNLLKILTVHGPFEPPVIFPNHCSDNT